MNCDDSKVGKCIIIPDCGDNYTSVNIIFFYFIGGGTLLIAVGFVIAAYFRIRCSKRIDKNSEKVPLLSSHKN
jgi:hypothetical protein